MRKSNTHSGTFRHAFMHKSMQFMLVILENKSILNGDITELFINIQNPYLEVIIINNKVKTSLSCLA